MRRIRLLKRVIITGGTGGLGKAISAKFKSSEWEVIALGSRDLDLMDVSALAQFFASNPCDLLVCSAGIVRDQLLIKMDSLSWDEIWDVNFKAARNCARAAIPEMIENKSGHVVFISSYAALHPALGQSAYTAAKAALLGLTQELASTHGVDGIRVNAILPGFMETPMTATVPPERKQEVRLMHTLKAFNTPEIAADFIYFLEQHLPHTSGQIFQLDSRRSIF